MIKIIDLHFQDETHLIAAFLIKTQTGGILIETGPYSCHQSLKNGLAENGLSLGDIEKVLVTHIHLDHSGGAWALAEAGATIYAHPIGVPHLINPEKLVNSAGKIYQDKMKTLWSDIKDIEREKVKELNDEETISFINPDGVEKKITAHYTPGHASHHLAFQLDKTLFAGDVLGLKTEDSPLLLPSPPPEVNLELWRKSLKRIETINPEKIFLTHFGEINDPLEYLKQCSYFLNTLENWYFDAIKNKLPTPEIEKNFLAFTHKLFQENNLTASLENKVALVNPPLMTVSGFLRYFKKYRGLINE